MSGPVIPGERATDPPRFGSFRAKDQIVVTDDGAQLHVEVDEPRRPDPDNLTVLLVHGYALSCDSWHYQRLALHGKARVVCYDHRGHGRSTSGPPENASIDRLGVDLGLVIDAVAPNGPLVVVGHSMGGMTTMAYVAAHTEQVRRRVVGVGLVATTAYNLSHHDFGLGSGMGKVFNTLAPHALNLAARGPKRFVESSRRFGSELEAFIVNRYSYASSVSPEVTSFTAQMIAGTPIRTLSEFLPAINKHDKREALRILSRVEALVMVGDKDRMTPLSYSERIVRRLPHAEMVVVHDSGHMVMLEYPDVTNYHLDLLIRRARRALHRDELG